MSSRHPSRRLVASAELRLHRPKQKATERGAGRAARRFSPIKATSERCVPFGWRWLWQTSNRNRISPDPPTPLQLESRSMWAERKQERSDTQENQTASTVPRSSADTRLPVGSQQMKDQDAENLISHLLILGCFVFLKYKEDGMEVQMSLLLLQDRAQRTAATLQSKTNVHIWGPLPVWTNKSENDHWSAEHWQKASLCHSALSYLSWSVIPIIFDLWPLNKRLHVYFGALVKGCICLDPSRSFHFHNFDNQLLNLQQTINLGKKTINNPNNNNQAKVECWFLNINNGLW